MLTLYATSESLYCAKLRTVLRYKQLEWNEVSPEGGCGSESYRAMIPGGTMPSIDDDGFVLADSEAIIEYLDENHPEPALLPVEPKARARTRERARFHDTRLEPEIRYLFPFIDRKYYQGVEAKRQTDAINQRLAEFARVLDADQTLNTNEFTLGDCGFPITFAWLDCFTPILGLEIEWPEQVLSYRAAIESHPAVSEELRQYQAGMVEWIAGKNV
jgi:glutathione S-transferase